MTMPPESDEPLVRERYDREAEREGNQPVLWGLLGLLLIGLFVLMLQIHWFGG
jgi:hypothetical protein